MGVSSVWTLCEQAWGRARLEMMLLISMLLLDLMLLILVLTSLG